MKRASEERLAALYNKAQEKTRIIQARGYIHPYALLRDEVEDDALVNKTYLIVNGEELWDYEDSTIENMFSLYGDVDVVYRDDRRPPHRFFIIQFADDEAVQEVIDNEKDVAIGKVIIPVYRVSNSPNYRSG